MRFGSLFTGIGGLDLGFERTGMECAWQVEIDSACRRVLHRHWPHVERFNDVREVGAAQLPPVDLLCGGFPCQDLSVAGGRAGLNGPRSRLFYEFARIIHELKPAWAVIENVPGLLSSRSGRDMGAVLGTLAELGYGFAYRVLDAQYFGVAQRRRRVFIVGRLGDGVRAAQVLLEPQGVLGHPSPGGETRPDLAIASSAGALQGGGRLTPMVSRCLTAHHGRNDGCETLLPTYRIATRPHGTQEAERWEATEVANTLNPWNLLRDPPPHVVTCVTGDRTHPLRAEGADASEDGSGRGTPIIGVLIDGYDGRPSPEDDGDSTEPRAARRGADGPLLLANTVRRLTPRECERLQGFPDDWTAGEPDARRYRQLGNAVCVPVAAWIGNRLVTLSSGPGRRKPRRPSRQHAATVPQAR
jgi:DNA (cytosine-5)-methyltransferase 1